MRTFIIVMIILMAIKALFFAFKIVCNDFDEDMERLACFVGFLVKIGLIIWGVSVL